MKNFTDTALHVYYAGNIFSVTVAIAVAVVFHL